MEEWLAFLGGGAYPALPVLQASVVEEGGGTRLCGRRRRRGGRGRSSGESTRGDEAVPHLK